MKEQIKFPSMAGFSLGHANAGETIGIGVLLNCKDDYTQESKLLLTQSTLDDIVYPEVVRRAARGELPMDFKLIMAHVLMYADESKNEVLLNEEVCFVANVTLNDGKQLYPGQAVTVADIKDILGLYPSKKNNPNAAHIMLLKVNGRWYYACNLVYNIETVRKKFEHSSQFFETAKDCLSKKHWAPLVDNLYSATELAIQSLLLLTHRGGFSIHQTHDSTTQHFTSYTTTGNLDTKYTEHFSKLKELRKKGRYLIGVHGKKFSVDEAEIMKRFYLTNDLMNYVKSLLDSRGISRTPPNGHIIALGQG
jgi:hypothetical protein